MRNLRCLTYILIVTPLPGLIGLGVAKIADEPFNYFTDGLLLSFALFSYLVVLRLIPFGNITYDELVPKLENPETLYQKIAVALYPWGEMMLIIFFTQYPLVSLKPFHPS
jgi:hypothetical protein